MTETVMFVDGVSYTEADQAEFNRSIMRPQGILPEEVTGQLPVSAIGGMFVRVGIGVAFIQGFVYRSDAVKDLAIAPNSSGSTRIDYVILKLDRVANTLVSQIKAGVPGAGAPTLTQVVGGIWEFPLAQVTVVNAASVIAGGNILDTRAYSRWSWQALDPLVAREDEVTAMIAATTVPFCRVTSNAQSVSTGGSYITLNCDNEEEDLTSMHSTTVNPYRITANVAGVYVVTATIGIAANATGYRSLYIGQNGGPPYDIAYIDGNSGGTYNYLSVSGSHRLAVGDWVFLAVAQTSGIALSTFVQSFTAVRVGS